ncbi:hypothetical protein TA3x_000298 [Tundrisphaera sp. TA3]|uniref:hypothetical protein n=1 Tax=Tundrisphaera sp. TA3 TaxID=3435775 RepID=UPI003EBA8784
MDDPGPSEIDRTRSAVLNILVAASAGIAASGWLLRDREITEAPPGGTLQAHRLAMLLLLGLVAIAYATLRAGPGKFRVIAAAVAALAVPLGLAHGWYVDPALPTIAPFWVAALGLGALAYPRGGRSVPGADERSR